jgi:hypothetical protein
MKLIAWFISMACAAGAQGVADVKAVYLMPMSRGLDQYLAQRLSAQGIVQVVTDPKKADAVFSDRIGSNFEETLMDLFKEPVSKEKKEDDSLFTRPAMQPLSRGKGNIFLVDLGTHSVLWSAFVVSKSTDAKDLNHVADQIADQLAKARKKK